MPSPTTHRTARLLATTSMIALTLATTPINIPTLDDGAFVSSAQAESCCFVGETEVILSDGRSRPIAQIAVGMQVMGPDSRAHRVVRVERPRLGARKLYALNGGRPFVTAEHPFMTETGWRAVDPEATFSEAPRLRVDALRPGDRMTRGQMTLETPAIGALALAPQPRVALHHVLLEAVAAHEADPGLEVFNLVLADGHSFFADGFLVHNKGGDDDGSSGGGSSGGGGSGGGDSGGSGLFGESGDSGDSGSSGFGSGSGESGDSGQSGGTGESGDPFLLLNGRRPDAADLQQVGADLTQDEERVLIGSDWQ